jgi:hypothetical protein
MITTHGLEQLGFDPDKDFVLSDEGNGVFIKEWNSNHAQPSVTAIETAEAEWQSEQDATQYQRDRQAEYPSIDALVVALWEGVVEERMESATALEELRQAVKAKHPKP